MQPAEPDLGVALAVGHRSPVPLPSPAMSQATVSPVAGGAMDHVRVPLLQQLGQEDPHYLGLLADVAERRGGGDALREQARAAQASALGLVPKAPREGLVAVGTVLDHRRYGYRGVVVGWDALSGGEARDRHPIG